MNFLTKLAACRLPWRGSSIVWRTNGESGVRYLQVNALGEWIIGIYLHEFTNNEREISIPHEAAECGIEKFRVHC